MNIAVLVSGGVDSSLALKFLKDAGHSVTAFYLKIWLEDELSHLGSCPWEDDLAYVQSVCDMLGVPLQVISLQKEYWQLVVSHSIAAIKEGLTPNPDILCNQYIKFGVFYDLIGNEFDKVATGHYAQLTCQDGIYLLKRSPDPVKDQTYFLCNLSQEQLSRALFPIGHLEKNEVRSFAHQFNLPTKNRKDSQGICFLGTFKFTDFVRHHLGEQPGTIVEYETGKIKGHHEGHWFYTIGQRQGIKLSGGPWYVVAKNSLANIIYISNHYDAIDAPRSEFSLQECQWFTGSHPTTSNLLVKVRHRATPQPCTIIYESDKEARVQLLNKDQGIAPGQRAVFYDGDLCLGSGMIV